MLYSFWENANKEHRTFTTEELADMFNTSKECINMVKHRLGLTCKIVIYNGAKHNQFTYSDYCQFKNFYDIRKQKGVVRKCDIKEIKEIYEAETLESKLITDKRCYKLDWWPDITPTCFMDI